MSEFDYEEAKKTVGKFYRRKNSELTAMRASANLAGINFSNLLHEKEKEIKSLGKQIFEAAFGLALGAVPGALYLTKSWKAIAAERPIFADNFQYISNVVVETGVRVSQISPSVGAGGQEKTITGAIAENLQTIHSRINKGLEYVEKEQSGMEDYILEKYKENDIDRLKSASKYLTGAMPPVFEQHQRDLLAYAFEYELIHAYVKSNVTIIWETFEDTPGRDHHEVNGLNDEQLKYIYGKFGKNLSTDQAREIANAVASTQNLGAPLNPSDRLASILIDVKRWTQLKPILEPKDLLGWGAKYKRSQHYQRRPHMQR